MWESSFIIASFPTFLIWQRLDGLCYLVECSGSMETEVIQTADGKRITLRHSTKMPVM
jgi:hypothetical protein